jgi:hypothetical protein
MDIAILALVIVAFTLAMQQALLGWAWNAPRTRWAAICAVILIGLLFAR